MEPVWGLRDTFGQYRIPSCRKFTNFSNKFSESTNLLINHKTCKRIANP